MADKMRVVLATKSRRKNFLWLLGIASVLASLLLLIWGFMTDFMTVLFGILLLVAGIAVFVLWLRMRRAPNDLIVAYEDGIEFYDCAVKSYRRLRFSELNGVSEIESEGFEHNHGDLSIYDRSGNEYIVRGVDNLRYVQGMIRRLMDAAAETEVKRIRRK